MKTLPTRKKLFSNYFRLPFHDFNFFELNLENYPIPIAFVWVVWHYPVGTPVLAKLFFITVTRFEFFRINWVMFWWQMVYHASLAVETRAQPGLAGRYGVTRATDGRDLAVFSSVALPPPPQKNYLAIFPMRERENGLCQELFSLKRPFSLSRMGKIASRRGVENRGSVISVPLALRVFTTTPPPPQKITYAKNSRGIIKIFGVIARLSRNQLRKRILWELFLGSYVNFA